MYVIYITNKEFMSRIDKDSYNSIRKRHMTY